MINTRFWNDSFISRLDPIEKLLFIYFMTNEHTNICGIYELPLKIAAIETGIDESMFKKILGRLKPKILYRKGWVIVTNFPRHQQLNLPMVKKGFTAALSHIPAEIIDYAVANGYPMHCQSIGNALPTGNIDSDSDLDSDLENTVAAKAATGGTSGKKKKTKTPSDTPINWPEYLESMDKNPQLHVQLIGYYFKRRKISYDTHGEVQEAISRHSKAAVRVAKFGKAKVFEAMDRCDRMNGIRWTLETVYKELTK